MVDGGRLKWDLDQRGPCGALQTVLRPPRADDTFTAAM